MKFNVVFYFMCSNSYIDNGEDKNSEGFGSFFVKFDFVFFSIVYFVGFLFGYIVEQLLGSYYYMLFFIVYKVSWCQVDCSIEGFFLFEDEFFCYVIESVDFIVVQLLLIRWANLFSGIGFKE